MQKKTVEKAREVLLGMIDLPEHIDREEINSDYISELAESIKEIGLLSPIILRSVNSRFELIVGHRRLLAHKVLGRGSIPSIVREMTDGQAILARAIENLQRVDLTVIEEAKVYQVMAEKLGMGFEEIGRKVGKSQWTVRSRLSLLKLKPVLLAAIHKGQIIPAVAQELDILEDVGKIECLLGFCVENGATLSVVKNWVQDEMAKEQQAKYEGLRVRGDVVIPKSMPVYVPCDLCTGPMSIGSEAVIRCCPDCVKKLNEVLK